MPCPHLQGGGGSTSDDGSGSSNWLSGVFGSPTATSSGPGSLGATAAAAATAAAGRVSIILPYTGVYGLAGGGSSSGIGTAGGGGGGSSSGLLGEELSLGSGAWQPYDDMGYGNSSYGGDLAGEYGRSAAGTADVPPHVAVPYGSSCCWHPSRDLVVVGYSDGCVQAVGLGRQQAAAADRERDR